MYTKYHAASILACLSCWTVLGLQQQAQTQAKLSKMPNNSKQIVTLKSGDFLHFSVVTKEGILRHSFLDYFVDLNGNVVDNIWHDNRKQVHLAGLTIKQAQKSLFGSPPHEGKYPVIFTSLQHNMIQVSIMGGQNVALNGDQFFLQRNSRLSDVLKIAKLQPGADLSNIEVWETSDRVVRTNFGAYLAHKNMANNPIVQNGAEIVIGPLYGGNPQKSAG